MRHKDERLKCARCLFAVGLGVKLVTRFTGLAQTSLKRFRREAGIPVSTRKTVNWGTKTRTERWMNEAWDAEWAKGQRYIGELRHWAKHPSLPSREMVIYYADIHASRKRGRENAKRRYATLEKGCAEHIKRALRLRVWKTIKRDGGNKDFRTMDLVGCSIDTLRAHLASLFAEGMRWENYGEWEIDHVRPCNAYDLSQIEQQRLCFHYTNLQPLWRADNRRKWARVA